MLRVTVLGGAAAWPNPGQGCSSYLVETDKTRVLLDCGSNTLLELRKHVDWSSIDAVIISHCHADHMLDLVPYRYGLFYGRKKPDRMIPIWLPPGGERVLEGIANVLADGGERSEDFWRSVFVLENYDPEGTLEIGDLTIRFAPTQHFIPCFAMRVEAPSGESLLYGADTGDVDSLIEFACDADLLISEGTADSYEGVAREDRGHITPEDAGRWAGASGARRLLLTHLWCGRPESEVISQVRKHYNGKLDIAYPGLMLDVE